MSIQRYESKEPFYDPFAALNGEWVKFEDVVKLIRQADCEVHEFARDMSTDWAQGYLYACAVLLKRIHSQPPGVYTVISTDSIRTKDGAA